MDEETIEDSRRAAGSGGPAPLSFRQILALAYRQAVRVAAYRSPGPARHRFITLAATSSPSAVRCPAPS
jgi:hypothetical protein